MPQVPVSQGNAVRLADRPVGAVQPVRLGDGLGEGLQSAGKALASAADVEEQMQLSYDTAAAKKLDNEAADRVRGLLYTNDDAFYKQEGFNAQEYRPVVEQGFTDLRSEMLGKARNDRQRAMLGQVFDRRFGQELEGVARYSSQQIKAEEKLQSAARIDGLANDAILTAGDPKKFGAYRGAALQELGARSEQEGWGEDRLQNEIRAFDAKMFGSITQGMLTEDRLDDALTFFNDHKGGMDWGTQQALQEKLKPAIQFRQADEDAKLAMGMIPFPVATEDGGSVAGAPVAPITAPGLASHVAVIEHIESRGRQFGSNGRALKSPVGATGIMQIMPATGPEAARDAGLKWDKNRFENDTSYNRALGQAYYRKLMNRYNGDPVKAAAAYNCGMGRVDSAIRKHGANWVNGVPSETRDYVRQFQSRTGGEAPVEGASGVVASAPRKWDLAQAYGQLEQVAADQEWTPERLERARGRIDDYVRRDETLESRRSEELFTTALDAVDKLGDGFTNVSQIPGYASLKPEQRIRLGEQAAHNRAPKPVAADNDTALGLRLMAIASPEEFKGTDLRQYRDKMTPGEFASLAEKQVTLRKPAGAGKSVNLAGAVSSTISLYATEDMKLTGKKADRADFLAVHDTMMADLQRVTGGTRAPTDAESKAAFGRATQEVVVKKDRFILGFSAGTVDRVKPRYDLTIEDVPGNVRGRIERDFKRTMGRAPTEEEITGFYRRNMGRF